MRKTCLAGERRTGRAQTAHDRCERPHAHSTTSLGFRPTGCETL
jgi:hypothetical protein